MLRAAIYTLFSFFAAAASANTGWLAANELLVADFEDRSVKLSAATEKADPTAWLTTGRAFVDSIRPVDTNQPTGRDTKLGAGVEWACGQSLVYSGTAFGTTGTLTSPTFKVEKNYLSFLIGGSRNLNGIAVQLLHDDHVVRAATGTGNAALRIVAFDLRELKGKQVRLRFIDRSTDSEGYLITDRFVQTDEPATQERINSAPAAGTYQAQTLAGSIEGEVNWQGDRLTIGDKAVALDGMLSLITPAIPDVSNPEGVVLRNGDSLRGRIVSYRKGGKLRIDGAFGSRELSLSDVASINFTDSPPKGEEAADTIYRQNDGPIPGKLVWIKDTDVAIDCVLGILPVPREQITRFVVAPPNAVVAASGAAELRLVDGSLIRAKTMTVKDHQFLVQHPLLGELKLGLDGILSIRRTPKEVVWLTTPSKTAAAKLIGSGVHPVQTAGTLRLPAASSATYELPANLRNNAVLRGTLAPIANARGKMQVMLKAAGKTIWQTKIEAGGAPVDVSLKLPAGNDFSIAVAYDGAVSLPCGSGMARRAPPVGCGNQQVRKLIQ